DQWDAFPLPAWALAARRSGPSRPSISCCVSGPVFGHPYLRSRDGSDPVVAFSRSARAFASERRVWRLGLVDALMGMGKPGRPAFGFMRFPIKFVVAAGFIFPLLLAYSISGIAHIPRQRWRGGLGAVSFFIVLVAGISVLRPYGSENTALVCLTAAMRLVALW